MSQKCSLCDSEIEDDVYPQYQIRLKDESDTGPNRSHEDHLCSRCWETLYQTLSPSTE